MGTGPLNADEVDAGALSFLGRARELGDLAAALAEARAGRGRLYLVRGEAGIGKTSLAEEVSSRARAAGADVHWGRCWDGESAPPYWPWVQILRACIRAGSAAVAQPPAAIAADLCRLLPELSTQTGNAVDADSEQARFRLFGAVTHVLREAASARPAVLVLDDLHAADAESLLLLRFLARELRSAAILVLATYREGDARRSAAVRTLLADIAREARTIPLAGLGPVEVREFARQRTGVVVDDGLLDELQRVTEGNPFFVEEVLQLLVDEDRLTAGRPSVGLRVPESVRGVIRRRLDVLPPATCELLAAAAVLGNEIDAALLEKMADLSPGGSADLLAPAAEAGIVRAAGASQYAFSRALFREALYDELTFPRRVELHRRAGTALLAADLEESVDELAHHFLHAAPGGSVDMAVSWATRAGDRAMERVAYEAAASFFTRALAVVREAPLLPGSPDEWQRRRIEILIRLGNACVRSGDVAAADEAYVDAFARARAIGDGRLMARVALGLGQVRLERGRSDATLHQWLEEALALLGPESSALRARVMARLTESSFFARLEPRRADLSQQAVEAARQSGDRGALADALNARHHELWQPGSMRERLELADEITRLADEAGEQTRAISGLGWRIYSLLELGEMTAADTTIAEYERRAEALRHPRYRWFANVFRTSQALLRGAFDEVERLLEKGMQIRLTTDTSPSQFYAAQMFFLRREQGRVVEAGAALRAVLQVFPALTSWNATLALFQVESGEIEEARSLFTRLAAQGFADINVDATWLTSMSLLAEVCAALRDTTAAASLCALLLPYAMHNAVIVGGVACLGAVPFFLGKLAATLERWEEAAGHFQEACARHERIGAWPLLAQAQQGYAEALDHCGRSDEATRLRAAAQATARDFGLARLLQPGEDTAAVVSPSPAASFRRDGDHWAVVYAGQVIRLRNSRGCEYLAHLLARPGERIAARELLAASAGAPVPAGEEQARIAVRKALHVVLRALEGELPALHEHLTASLRTGRWCVYAPEPPLGAPWEVDR